MSIHGTCVLVKVSDVHTEKSYQIKPKSDCIYHFPIDLEPNGRLFGYEFIGKLLYIILFRFDLSRFRKDFCVCKRVTGRRLSH